MVIIDVIKVFAPSIFTFFVGVLITPILTHYLYKYKMWKHKAGKVAMDGKETVIFNSLHKDKEVGTPRMGGIIIWLSPIITVSMLWLIWKIFPSETTHKIEFLSRSQTWVPFFALIMGAFVGLIDDILEIRGSKDHIAGGLSLKKRLIIVGLVSLFCAFWFYYKLDVVSIGLPFVGNFYLGWAFIPLFVATSLFIYSGGVIDGIDGLAGGIFATIFSAYTAIALYQHQIDLAAFCAVVVGGILAFLWFNVPPARFYMSETGSMALTLSLTVVAFMTDSLSKIQSQGVERGGYGFIVLPIVAFPLVLTTFSNIIQVSSKKIRGKKIFLVAPLHHHFEAKGWPSYKVTMRYWIMGVVFAILGVVLAFIG